MTNQDGIPPTVADAWAQASHLCGGALAVALPAAMLPGFVGAPFVGFGAILIFAAVKEFWWDLRHETPTESGGIGGGWEDFSHYCMGAVIALAMINFALRVL